MRDARAVVLEGTVRRPRGTARLDGSRARLQRGAETLHPPQLTPAAREPTGGWEHPSPARRIEGRGAREPLQQDRR